MRQLISHTPTTTLKTIYTINFKVNSSRLTRFMFLEYLIFIPIKSESRQFSAYILQMECKYFKSQLLKQFGYAEYKSK